MYCNSRILFETAYSADPAHQQDHLKPDTLI